MLHSTCQIDRATLTAIQRSRKREPWPFSWRGQGNHRTQQSIKSFLDPSAANSGHSRTQKNTAQTIGASSAC